MPKYDAQLFDPPAPIARVVVRGEGGTAESDVAMLLDSGADISIVPRAIAERVHPASITEASGIQLQMYDGTRAQAHVAVLRVELLGLGFTGQFAVVDSDHGVLGRNILNELVLALDGPRQEWQIGRR